jgi:hypothetical protein
MESQDETAASPSTYISHLFPSLEIRMRLRPAKYSVQDALTMLIEHTRLLITICRAPIGL